MGSSVIVGGVDVTGAHLYSVYPHGSYDKLPFLTMGICLAHTQHISHLLKLKLAFYKIKWAHVLIT